MNTINHLILKRPCHKYGIEITDCDKFMGDDKTKVCAECVKEARSIKKGEGKGIGMVKQMVKKNSIPTKKKHT